jgi:hypothetical protein
MKHFLTIHDYLPALEDYLFVDNEMSETTLVKHEFLTAFYTGARTIVDLGCKDTRTVEKMANILCTALGCFNYIQMEDAETGASRLIDARWSDPQKNCAAALHRFLRLKAQEEYGAPELLQVKWVFEAVLGAILEETTTCCKNRNACKGTAGIAHHSRYVRTLLNAVYQSDSGEPEFDVTKLPSGPGFDNISLGLWKEFSQAYLDYVSYVEG